MSHREAIHEHIRQAAFELLAFVRECESLHPDRWVPAAQVKAALKLNMVAVPKSSTQYGEKGWLFATLARLLEDLNMIEYKRIGSRAFFRSTEMPPNDGALVSRDA
jgi:hypothetical protein